MRQILRSISLVALFALVGPFELEAQQCRNENLRGSFGLVASAVALPPLAPFQLPYRRLSTSEFDGSGNFKGTTLASLGGQLVPDSFDGPYTVNPDCTVDFTAHIPSASSPQFSIAMKGILTDHFTKLDFMVVSPAQFVGIGRIQKQRLGKCTQRDLAGSFQLDLSGQVLQPPPAPPLQIARFGKLVADGAGNFTASTHVNNNGTVEEENLSGTYTVDSECKLDFSYGGFKRLSGVLIDGGQGAFLLQVYPENQGVVIGGSLARASRP